MRTMVPFQLVGLFLLYRDDGNSIGNEALAMKHSTVWVRKLFRMHRDLNSINIFYCNITYTCVQWGRATSSPNISYGPSPEI